jgi:hypothetical protein
MKIPRGMNPVTGNVPDMRQAHFFEARAVEEIIMKTGVARQAILDRAYYGVKTELHSE